MSKHEKRLRESLGPSMLHHLEMLLAEKAEEKSHARAEALEEAACYHDRKGDGAREQMDLLEARAASRGSIESWRQSLGEHRSSAVDIRALLTTPAPAPIPVERVREEACRVLQSRAFKADPIDEIHAMLERLGVDLDANGDTTCRECGHPPHHERCVRAVSPQHSRGGAVAARACGCEAKS